jgi:Cu+-exporting ATPase
MELAPHAAAGSAQATARLEAEESEYACPMHPEVVTASPGRCPTCGMELELRGSPEDR